MLTRKKRTNPSEMQSYKASKEAKTSTPTLRVDVGRQRSVSPFSITRNDEKDELAYLNDRLASYIDYVRQLELEKQGLKKKITSYTEERVSRSDDLRSTYEAEIASLRRIVDDIGKEKATADVVVEKYKEDLASTRSRLTKLEMEKRQQDKHVKVLEHNISVFKQNSDRYDKLKPEFESMETRCERLRRDLEEESVNRAGLENEVSGLRKELDFKNRLIEEESKQFALRTGILETMVAEKETSDYESRLFEELKAYRDQTAEDLLVYKTEMKHIFETKLDQLRNANDEASRMSGKMGEDLLAMRQHADDLEQELAKKNAEVDLLKRRVEELERFLRRERQEYEGSLAAKQEEVDRLHRELQLRFAEFTDLMNTKVALDQEILMYRKMLEGEESRLNISTTGVHKSAFTTHGTKRRRVVNVDIDDEVEGGDVDEGVHSISASSPRSNLTGEAISRVTYRVTTSANGNIEFTEHQEDLAKCVKLLNSSNDETNIGNWELKQCVGGSELSYRFQRSLLLKPGAACTIWSNDMGSTHNPPDNIVMENETFKKGDRIRLTLADSDGDEQASCEIVREGARSMAPQLRPHSSEEKCRLM